MKKIIVLIIISLLNQVMNAQICIPGTLTAPKNAYILPDSATNFANACPGTNYQQILYIKAAKDTAITVTTPLSGVITADIDSFVVDANITNLPSYLSIESVPTALPAAGPSSPKSDYLRMRIPGDSLACAKISGLVPSGTAPGTFALTIKLRVYLSNLHSTNLVLEAGIPTLYPGRKTDTNAIITYYRIVVEPTPCWPTSVPELVNNEFQIIGNVPNPSSSSTQIQFVSEKTEFYQLKLSSLQGATILTKDVSAVSGSNYIHLDVANLAEGIYTYSLSNGQKTITKKLQILR